MSDLFGTAMLMLCAFWWGEWYAQRRAKKHTANADAAFRLLYGMVKGIIEKRQFVGRGMTISREERFEVVGEKFSLTLQSEGDPRAVEPEIML